MTTKLQLATREIRKLRVELRDLKTEMDRRVAAVKRKARADRKARIKVKGNASRRRAELRLANKWRTKVVQIWHSSNERLGK